jgi:uracil phosphoribosyltransferase
MTVLRDETTTREEFRRVAELLGEYLVMEAVNRGLIPTVSKRITTPTSATVDGLVVDKRKSIIAIPILRAGSAFTSSVLRLVSPSIPIAHLVIQRDEATALPVTLLDKLPHDIANADCVLVLDPMLATGGSINAAINVLVGKGVAEEKIVLLHGVGCPQGVAAVSNAFPKVRGIVAVVDSHLNERKFILPGLGDFGDRYFC